VPYTRGAEYSRPAADVLAEASRLVAGGAREITLLGQNVNAYHGAGPDGAEWSLGRLIRAVADVDGLARIRYTTSHPRDMDEDLIAAHAEVPALMPYLHLPVQSGSDRVLGLMNRRHRVADYLATVAAVRRRRPDIALSSDFIVGHPGETEHDFAATLALVREVGYAQAYSFKYSPRPGTPAADAADQVPDAAKADRLRRLQELLGAQQRAFNRRAVGRVIPVLFDRPGGRPGQAAGRSPHMQAVNVDCPDPAAVRRLIGAIAPVRVVAAHANSLAGEIVAAPRPREASAA
jgi:tRNA-2-methylthio-N6-dimethylallyladenosine synthase